MWELYNTEVDRSECKNLADQEPVKLRELQDLWFVEAGKYFGLPLEDRGAIAVLTTPRPQMSRRAAAISTTRTRSKCPRRWP